MPATLGKIELRPPEDIEVGSRRLDVFNDAVRDVESRGLVFPTPPHGYQGEMPRDITSLDDDDLGDLLSKLSTWTGYVDSELAKTDAARKAAEKKMDFVRARIRIGVKANSPDDQKLTNSDKDDLVETDERVVKATGEYMFAETKYILTRTLRDNAQRDWDTVSRRITQRGQEVDRIRRGESVSAVPAGARTFIRPHR